MLRSSGLDEAYAVRLAQLDVEFEPIVVQRDTLRIIDGLHRWRAAQLRGRSDINASLVDVDEDGAYLRAVRANAAHGLPLELADRRNAAAHLIAIKPEWSDRAIGREVGLSGKTVASIRRTDQRADSRTARRGIDGRVRPINAAAGRRLAVEILARRPDAPLREVAKAAGISASTVRHVKERIRRGEDPIARRTGGTNEPAKSPPEPALVQSDMRSMLGSLMRDPSLRYTQVGRTVLSWLRLQAELTRGDALMQALPAHCLQRIAQLSRQNALRWEHIADLARTTEEPGANATGS
jgi:ParB-like chromosome segregation protein Spo0J